VVTIKRLLNSLAIICLSGLLFDTVVNSAAYGQTNDKQEIENAGDASTKPPLQNEKPLNVPVYPKGSALKKAPSDITDLHEQYILLNDGSVITMADWILGALKTSDLNREMSDLDRRLFLGEVARNMMKEGRILGVRPAVPVKPEILDDENYDERAPKPPAGIFANRLPFLFKAPQAPIIDNGILNGPVIGRFNDITGTSDPAEINGGKIRLLPDAYETAFDHLREDWQRRGTYLLMLEKHKKTLEKNQK